MVAHAGAIALGIASISEVFRTIFLPNLVDTVMNLHRQDGGPSIFPFVGLRREEIEPFFKDSERLNARQTALSGTLCLLSTHRPLQEKVKQPGEWYGLHNALSGQAMIHHY